MSDNVKNLMFILTATVFATSAQASFYQTECSDATGMIRTSQGHLDNILTITNREAATDLSNGQTNIPIYDVRIENLESVELSSESDLQCWGGGSGIWSSKTIEAVKVKMTMIDGALFPAGTYGASQDLLSIETYLICETNLNGRAPCDSNE